MEWAVHFLDKYYFFSRYFRTSNVRLSTLRVMPSYFKSGFWNVSLSTFCPILISEHGPPFRLSLLANKEQNAEHKIYKIIQHTLIHKFVMRTIWSWSNFYFFQEMRSTNCSNLRGALRYTWRYIEITVIRKRNRTFRSTWFGLAVSVWTVSVWAVLVWAFLFWPFRSGDILVTTFLHINNGLHLFI